MLLDINGTPLESEHLAKSAFDNDIDLDSLLATIDNFHAQSSATKEEKERWGADVLQHYFGMHCDGQQ